MRRGARPALAAALAGLLALGVAACGADSQQAGAPTGSQAAPPSAPVASAPDATAPPSDATGPATAPPPSTSTSTSPETGAGQGDEQPARVPARFTFASSGVKPRTVSAPSFLAVTITIVSADGRPHTVEIDARGRKTLTVGAGARAALDLAGLRAGHYPLRENGRTVATLVIGGEPGP